MNDQNTFSYSYSAKNHQEVQEIRRKYLPQSESRLDELRQLDHQVQVSGMMESLSLGILGSMFFGLGFCFSTHIIGSGVLFLLLGVILGIAGALAMLLAYPVYRMISKGTRAKLAPRILNLASELCGENNSGL